MALIDRLREVVKDGPRGRLGEIAEQSGVPYKTLRNYYYGATKDMRYEAARRIEDTLNRSYGRRQSDRDDQQAAGASKHGQTRG